MPDRGYPISAYNPTTWADGFGNWHASVPPSDPIAEARQASAAIRAELKARDAIGKSYRLRVQCERVPGHGTIVYKEVSA